MSDHQGSRRRVLVKFGGNALSGEGDLYRFGEDIASLIGSRFAPIIVHGGGPEISQEMEKRGLKVQKIGGLRVTDAAALKVAADVLARINQEIVRTLSRAGVKAAGMSGCEASVIASKMPPTKVPDGLGGSIMVDLDRVGDVSSVDPARLEELIAADTVPVIYPICADLEGNEFNVNADTVAAHVARAAGAREMVLVTDVPGILKEESVIRSITLREIDMLIAEGTITGGMIPKVDACRTALENGVKIVYMLNGKDPHALVRKLIREEETGTKITVG
ncbi:MAG: acetylglutamate kinase [Methanomassiliicoccus sp.]|nr:acetylglutamate kinase [Methanomassiliicoccus sp.]